MRHICGIDGDQDPGAVTPLDGRCYACNQVSHKRIPEFVAYLRTKARSDSTIKAYTTDLIEFHDWLEGKCDAYTKLTIRDLNAYKTFLEDSGLLNKTINRKMGALRGFFNWQIENHVIETNPAKHIWVSVEPKYVYKQLTIEERQRLIDAVGENVRDLLMIRLLLVHKLPLSPLADLELDHTYHQNKVVIYVRGVYAQEGKGKKAVVLDELTSEIYVSYLNNIRQKLESDCTKLFFNKSGNQITRRSLQRRLAQLFERAGLHARRLPSLLRHQK